MKLFHIGAWESYAQTKLLKVMKLTALLLTIFSLHVAAHSSAQITYQAKNEPMKKVLDVIRVQAGIHMAYNDQVIDLAKPVTVTLRNTSVKEALEAIFKDQPLTYSIVGKSVFVIKRNEEVSDNTGSPVAPKLIDIKWKLVNAKGEPVVGATITIKGKNTVAISNNAGEFSFSEIEENATLLISNVAYETREIKINGKTENTLTLQIKSTELSEVSVTLSTGYQEIPKERATGSFAKVDNELLNRRVSTDVLSRIEGVTSGVLFDKTTDNKLGISVRGRSTIFASTQPLLVVDNFPYTGDINSINPNDVESITVLKDAAAASIWGAYSGNGVIVITTKKGKYNQAVKVELNTSVTITEKPDLFADKQFLNSTDFIDVEKYLFDKGFYNRDLTNTRTWPVLSPAVEIYNKLKTGALTDAQAQTELNKLRPLDIRNDYEKYLYRKAVGQQYALNISGGGPKSSYYLSGGYNDDLLPLTGNKNNRISFNSYATFKPISNLEVYGRIVYTQGKDQNNGISRAESGGRFSAGTFPYARLADDNGTPLALVRDYRSSFVQNPGVAGLLDWTYVPLNERDLNNSSSKAYDTRLIAGAKYNIFKGLSADFMYQYQMANVQSTDIKDVNSYEMRDLINKYSSITGNTVAKQNIPSGSRLLQTNNNTVSNSLRAQLSYNGFFGKSAISAIGGIDVQDTKNYGSRTAVYGYDPITGSSKSVNYDSSYLLFPSKSRGYIGDNNLIFSQAITRFRAFFANASYTYDNRYTLSLSGRMDQSNIFGVNTNQKSVPLWSTGVKWDIDKEDFYSISWLPSLSIRATYGFNGNVDRSITALTTARYNNGDGINNEPFVEIVSPGNPDLRWEKIAILNIGLSFELLKSRALSGSIEYFHKKGIDLFGDALVPSSTGFRLARGNYSNMVGNGFDLALNSKVGDSRFGWSATVLLSHTTDKITKNEGNTGKLVGKPVNAVYVYQWGGLDEKGDPIGILDTKPSKDYGEIINAVSNDPTLYKYMGPVNPTYFGSFRNTFSVKGFSISANIIFKAGYFYQRKSIQYSSLYNQSVGHEDFKLRWLKPGDEKITSVPAMVYTNYLQFSNRDNFYSNSEILVDKGDHIRFQDLSINYDVTKKFLKNIHFTSLQVYLYANNLGILWRANDHDIDPDFRTGYPNPKSYSIGVRAGL
jgi:TonB-linked SusC/RagA family outer membrane protein